MKNTKGITVLIIFTVFIGSLTLAEVICLPKSAHVQEVKENYDILAVTIVDVDNDGKRDVVAVTRGADADRRELSWYKNKGNSFSSKQHFPIKHEFARSVSQADVTGDNQEELLVTVAPEGAMETREVLYTQKLPDGSWSEFKKLPVQAGERGRYVQDVAGGDLDGNGMQDLLFILNDQSNVLESKMVYSLQTVNGFSEPEEFPVQHPRAHTGQQ